MYRLKIALSLLTISTFFLFFSISHAQITKPGVIVSSNPEMPAPFENVTISLKSYSLDLDGSKITWSVDGKVALSGTGKKDFSLITGALGSETRIDISVQNGEDSILKRIMIRPTEMDMLWEASDSYVPPFYRGKSLALADSRIKVVAIPFIKLNSGEMADPYNLVYSWKKDYKNLQDNSGYAKNSLFYSNDIFDTSNNISATVTTTDQSFAAQKSIDIGLYLPKLVFYENKVADGVLYENSIKGNFNLSGQSSISAEPYFISPRDIRNPLLSFNWILNDDPINTPIFKKILFLKGTEGQSGTAKVTLGVDNRDKLTQTVAGSLIININQ